MSEKTINFGDKEINKKDFYNNKKQFNIKDIDTNKILISKPVSYDKKISETKKSTKKTFTTTKSNLI